MGPEASLLATPPDLSGVRTMPSILSCRLLVAALSFQATDEFHTGSPFPCIHGPMMAFVGSQLA